MAWIYLLIAGILEWGWPVGLKYAWTDNGFSIYPALGALFFIVSSGVFLFLAQREIPMGTAYAVWVGIGAVGTFFLGIILFSEPVALLRFVFLGFIIIGIIGLKMSA